MPLDENAYETLAGIVGPPWVERAACVLDTYAYYQNPETMNQDGSQWLPRPAAVVLPESAEEIQEIMRFCSSSKYMAKPISTGFHTAAAASNDDTIILDLKRMDRILDIDEKNQIAVIEPYVRAIDLQTELLKIGLNCHIVSAGAMHSLLASHAAAWGYGVTGSSTSYSGRNLLGVEWVLPSGEIVTLGSAGSGSGWFSCEGPGPSMRGVMRGFHGTFGGLGVFTKCSIKLYKYDGPRSWDFEGQSPNYVLKEIPERSKFTALAFPTREAEKDGGYKMGEAELNYAEFRTPMFFTALGLTNNNLELKEALDSGLFPKFANHVLSCAFFAASDGEFAWKKMALAEILKETNAAPVPFNLSPSVGSLKVAGKLLAAVKDPLAPIRKSTRLQKFAESSGFGADQRRATQSRLFWLLVRNAVNIQAAFRPSQGMATMMGAFDTWDLAHAQAEYSAKAKQKYIEQGLIIADGGDLGAGGTFENGHLGYLEGIIMYDPSNPASVEAVRDLVESGLRASIDQALGVPIAGFGVKANKELGPACYHYDRWVSRLKAALDPNMASDPLFYAEPEDEP